MSKEFEPNRDEFDTDVGIAHGLDSDGEPFVELNLNGLPYRSTPDEATETGEAMIRVAQMSRIFHVQIELLRRKGWPDGAIEQYLKDIQEEYERMYGIMGQDE